MSELCEFVQGETSHTSGGEADVCSEEESLYLAVPRRGHVISTVAEMYGQPIREAVSILTGSLSRKSCSGVYRSILAPRRWQPDAYMARPAPEMIAWTIVAAWVSGVASEALPSSALLSEAEQWFFGGDESKRLSKLPSARAISRAEKELFTKVDCTAYFELLPYILDPHGPGSRLSVRRNPATLTARARKRAEGVFYTPADVADYMASTSIDSVNGKEPPSVFDPACGTGVFLRAAFQKIRHRHPGKSAFSLASGCMFGADIDPWSLDAAAFVLLTDVWVDRRNARKAPAEIWHRLRHNLACIDTLQIDPADNTTKNRKNSSRARSAIQELKAAASIGENDRDKISRIPISSLFPELKHGPKVVLGNPPYANVGCRSDFAELGRVFKTLSVKLQPTAEIYLPFIEQMIRLANSQACSGALVLPLSIACNIGAQYTSGRKLIAETSGHWRFSFFDREPVQSKNSSVSRYQHVTIYSPCRNAFVFCLI